LVKFHPFAPGSSNVAGDCDIRGGRRVDPARAQYFRACLSESKDNGYNCCAPIRLFSRAPAAKRQVNDAVSVVQAHPQFLMGFADHTFIGQSLIFPASAFFYIWSIN
jgi:hypothetical protein